MADMRHVNPHLVRARLQPAFHKARVEPNVSITL
jgi:hypothetical protein